MNPAPTGTCPTPDRVERDGTQRPLACGPYEPLKTGAYDPASLKLNRRVEIFTTENTASDYTPINTVPATEKPAPSGAASAAEPAEK